MREQFETIEWQTLKYAPLWVFAAVATADATIDEDEMAALACEVEGGDLYREPLVREVFCDMQRDEELFAGFKADARDMADGLAQTADILDRKAAKESAAAFKKMLVFVGRRVAEASGEDAFLADRMSGEEELSLFRVADILGVSLNENAP